MPLAVGPCVSGEAAEALRTTPPEALFPKGRDPLCAMAGLWCYFDCFEEAHHTVQDLDTAEAAYWHAVLHRREPDAVNAGYWFRRVGLHPVFKGLRPRLDEFDPEHRVLSMGRDWDPFAFVDFCEAARRRPGSKEEEVAMRLQLAEWQLLFHYCAAPPELSESAARQEN